MIAKDTIEEQIFERAKAKMVLEHAIIGNMERDANTSPSKLAIGSSANNKVGVDKEELDKILKFGAASMFAKASGENENEQLDSLDINEFLKNAEKREETATESSANEAFLNSFKVADFGKFY